MPLQNRVNPFGDIIETNSRGAWMGNRGLLHKSKKIIRPYKLLNWITCVLAFRGVRRNVMTDGRYTELFFLDEATSFAGGHRPCAECRRVDYTKFKTLWLEANKHLYDLPDHTIKSIDRVIHSERCTPSGEKITFKERLSSLPNGVFVQQETGSDPSLYFNSKLLKWTAFGYTHLTELSPETIVTVLTPKSYVRVFQKGYMPEVHHTAKAISHDPT
jgi:hypothetical protein